MPFPSSFFHLIIFATIIMVDSCHPCKNNTERLALLEIKAKIRGDPLDVMNSWNTNNTIHFCEWRGVTCAGRYNGVTKIDLHSSKLTGIISPYIGNLTFLRELRLENNSFSGVIPSEIGRLHRLTTLWLSYNSITGKIPSNLSSCYQLTNISLVSNKLVGEIPPSLGSLSKLRSLLLSVNNLTGNIPESLGNLSFLSNLTLTKNNFVGKISPNLGKLKSLSELSIGHNMFYGDVPLSIFNLSLMRVFSLQYNDLQGNLPVDLGNALPYLELFYVDSNRFSGHIPASLANCSNLQQLQLNNNRFQGQVPSLHKLGRLFRLVLSTNFLGYDQPADLDFVSSLPNSTFSLLEWLEIDKNNFGGDFPKIICNFTSLTALIWHHNNIAGEIPTCIENLSNLNTFLGHVNLLSGIIPQSIGMLQNLYHVHLYRNQLSGIIPLSIGNLTSLSTLVLSDNRLEGNIPLALANCTSLTELYLALNNLSGEIPSQLFNIQTFAIEIDLSQNLLTGSLPEEVGQLNKLGILDISHNMISGHIPNSLGLCNSLEFLNLSMNNFHGIIPDALQLIKGLQKLDLSYNNLTGQIPQFFISLQLQMLNLSHNKLEGDVPIGGIFSNASVVFLTGNNRLCGGSPAFNFSRCDISIHKGSKLKKKMIVAIISIIVGVLLLLALFVLLHTLWYKKRQSKDTNFGFTENFPNLSYQSLFKATNRFSLENLIGSGTYGVVYKGILEEDKSNVAIKVFNLNYQGSLESFVVECKVLQTIRHRNLLKVITACSSLDHHGRDFKALVYEYMVNGSLETWLHHPTQEINNDEEVIHTFKTLTIHQRLDIAVDIAFALDYLHHHWGDTPIVHCDLKPSNVLLNDEMVAHLGDFGQAKILFNGVSNSNANEYSSRRVSINGTIGYAPPEYGVGSEVSTYGDVYSFGILLLELFTGMKPTDDKFKGDLNLHSFVKKSLYEDINIIVDHVLLKDKTGELCFVAMSSIFEIALSCSGEVPQQRLDVSDVARQLLSIKNKLSSLDVAHSEEDFKGSSALV